MALQELSEQRLARLTRWCLSGRRAQAELELYAWRRGDDCPPKAVVLLAALFAQRGQFGDALGILDNVGQADACAWVDQLRFVLLLETGHATEARVAAKRLHHRHGNDPAVARWLELLVMSPGVAEAVPDVAVEQLVDELSQHWNVITSLVLAQQVSPDAQTIALLRRAIAVIMRDMLDDASHTAVLCQALAELAFLAGDVDDARRWAHRGLKANPYAAPLAIIVARIEDDAAVGPAAATVLARVAEAHPHYPDLRAAVIRREHDDGRTNSARMLLGRWLQQEPDHPIAAALGQEMAA